jgi:hypothetical protein
MTLNVHRVFTGSGGAKNYLSALTVDDATEATLRAARDKIRNAVKDGLRDWETLVRKQDLFESVFASVEPPPLRPKFRMQGSFSYRTCNVPAQTPPQEIDLDDGVFLPVSFLSQNGSIHPAIVSRGFFVAVERILDPLCKSEGWRLVKDKSSCVRVEVTNDAHIDLALYAIPDEDFISLVETASAKAAHTQNRVLTKRQLQESIEFADELYRDLPADHIMLAHRDEGWKKSDPRKLEDWFRAALKTYGEQVRRICRYLKGWRDYQWNACRLASIALMAAVIKAYEEAAAAVPENRDDKALLMVAERLPGILSGRIDNPVVEGARLDEGWSPEQRAAYVARAKDLHRRLQDALQGTDNPDGALASLTAAFGDRIPDDTDLIATEDSVETKSAVSSPAVLSLGLLKEMGKEPSIRDAVKKEGDSRYG